MKKNLFLAFLLYTFSLTFTQGQNINKESLEETQWFVDNKNAVFDIYHINLKIGDTVQLIQRINTDIKIDSSIFGLQEFTRLKHHDYANFVFNKESKLAYYLSSEFIPAHIIVGQMPIWTWKINQKNSIKLYKNNKYQLSLLCIKNNILTLEINGKMENINTLTCIRTKE